MYSNSSSIFSYSPYSFNGMEKDNEVKGEGNSYSTEFRQLDTRLGRWLSIDPLMHSTPWQAPYVAFDNNPITMVDPKGLTGEDPIIYYGTGANSSVVAKTSEETIKKILSNAGLTSATISSTQRTPEKQAQVMFNDLKSGAPDKYRKPGTAVQAVYYTLKRAGKSDDYILDQMIKEVYKQGPGKVSHHCGDPAKLTVVDISIKSIPADKQEAFVTAILQAQKSGLVSDFQYPGNNPNEAAFHIEIPVNGNRKMAIAEEVTVIGKRQILELKTKPLEQIPVSTPKLEIQK